MAKILITGSEGHIGKHLSKALRPHNTLRELDLVNNQHTKHIDTIYSEYNPDIIYHLGEYARIAPSFDEPNIVLDRNLVGTAAVLEYWRHKHCKLIYAASSSKFDDVDANPYTFTKSTNVELIKNYGQWYGLDYAICYFYNAFGEGELGTTKYATVIAKFIELYKQGLPLTIVLPGTQKRNFTYVKDIVNGMILVGHKGHGDGYALNNDKAYSIIEIAQAFNTKIEYIDGYAGRKQSGDIPTRAKELGWSTTVDVMDYINSIISHNGNRKTEDSN